jgi:hypothetical protein
MTDPASAMDATVHAAIAGRTAMAPVGIPELLDAIDYVERVAATSDELEGSLARLVGAGLIAELDGRRIVDGRSAIGLHGGTGISSAAFGAPRSLGSNREPPTDEQLLVAVPVEASRVPTPEEWRIAENLAFRMCEFLGERGRATRVVTLRESPGRIEFTVLGHATNDPARLRVMVLPLFEALAPQARLWPHANGSRGPKCHFRPEQRGVRPARAGDIPARIATTALVASRDGSLCSFRCGPDSSDRRCPP